MAPSDPRVGSVLIVDDDEAIREALADILQSEGWFVALASSGDEALKRVFASKPNLVILDQRMPGLTGAEVYRAMREGGLDIPVVLMTAAPGVKELATSLGIIDFLCKPFGVADILAVTARALARRESSAMPLS